MAGAYKGLTIRIGADTGKLNSALRGANSVIHKTQTELNKLSRAAKIDPGNELVAARQMGALAEQAVNASAKIDILKHGIESLGNEKVLDASGKETSQTIKELAENTDSVTLSAEAAKEAYTKVNSELNKVYAAIKKSTKGEVDLRKVTNEGNYSDGLLTELEKQGKVTAEQAAKIRELKPAWTEARSALDNYTKAAQFSKMNNDLAVADAQARGLARTFVEMTRQTDLSKSFGGLDAKLKQIDSAAKATNDRLGRLDKAAKLNPTSIGTAALKFRELGDAVETTQHKSELLRQKLEGYRNAGIDEIARGFGNVSEEVAKAEKALEDAKYNLDKAKESADSTEDEVAKLAKEFERAQRAADTAHQVQEYRELETQIAETDARLKELTSRQANTSVSAAAVNAAVEVGNLMQRAGSAVVDASNDVDSAYRNMRKTVDGTEEQYKRLYDAAMEYSQTHVTSADTMLEMEALAGQVGISADALENFAEVAANLDVATDIDAETIALQMGQITNVMSDLDENNVQGFADALVNLGNHMPAQESAIMQIAQRLSSVGDVAGFTTPEVLGWAAAIASTGQRSEAAATGISTTITSIQSAVSNGGDELDAFAKVVNMSSDEFKKAWGEDASGVLREFIGSIQNLGPDAIKQLEDLGIEGVRQTQTLLGLAKTVENVDEAMELSQGSWDRFASGNPVDGIGEAAQEASRKAEGFSGSLAKMQNSAQVLAASLGNSLIKYIDMAAKGMQDLTSWINTLDDDLVAGAAGVGTFLAAFAVVHPVVKALKDNFAEVGAAISGKFISGLGKVKTYADTTTSVLGAFDKKVAGIKGSFAKGVSSIKTFGGVLMSLGESGTIAAGAVGAVAAAVGVYYIKKFIEAKKHTEDMNSALEGMSRNSESVSRSFYLGSDGFEAYGDAASGASTSVEDLINIVKEHNERSAETRSSTETTIGMLQRYKEVIDDAMDAEDKSTVNVGELQWALDGLSDITGETYDAMALLNGEYANQEDSALRTKDAVDQLIESKKQEAKIDALKSMYTDALETQMKAKDALDEAQKKYDDSYELWSTNWIEQSVKHGMSAEEAEARVQDAYDKTHEKLTQDLSDAKRLYEGATEEADRYGRALGDLSAEEYAAGDGEQHFRENMMRENETISDTLDALWDGKDRYRDLAVAIRDTQGEVESMAEANDNFARLAPDVFSAMAEQAEGDLQTIADMVAAYDQLEIEDKEAVITVDDEGFIVANGERLEWNGSEWVSPEITVKTSTLPKSEEQIKKVSNEGKKLKSAKASYTATGNAATSTKPAQNIKKTTDAAGKIGNKNGSYTASGNLVTAGYSIADRIRSVTIAASGMSSKSITLTTNVVRRERTIKTKSATGTYIDPNKMPKHAAGIFTAPTLTNIGWVGEDGAELYSGNSLVPLTNRKYSMPYINDISDAVAKKLDFGGGEKSITLYVSCEGGPNETARAIVRALEHADI